MDADRCSYCRCCRGACGFGNTGGATEKEIHAATQSVLDDIEAGNKAYLEAADGIDKQNASVTLMVSKLDELAGVENKTAAQKAQMLSLVDKLNEAVPEMNLAYDTINGTLNMTADDMKKVTAAMIDQGETSRDGATLD